MKILLSAYACEPKKGSEPGVGWNWAIELAKLGHDVWVLTRANNQHSIEKELIQYPSRANLHFIYYDLPAWAMRLKKLPGGIYFYYSAWQWMVFKIAKQVHKIENFSIAHHITFGVLRQPSFLGKLSIPFFLGPIGGGERAPIALRLGYPKRGKLFDLIRDCLNIISRFDPLMRNTFERASLIFTKTPDTKAIIPSKYHNKTKTELEIGINQINELKPYHKKEGPFKLLFVGRFIYWKGMHLGLEAFSRVLKLYPDMKLTLVGRGPDEKYWKILSKELKISHAVSWIPWINHDELRQIYQTHNMLLFPSLHDSSGNVVLEALSYGLPVICLDLGGPGFITSDSCGIRIPVDSRSQNEIIELLADGIKKTITNDELYKKLKKGSIERAKQLSWGHAVKQVYDSIENVLSNQIKNNQFLKNLNSKCQKR
jgi:glycosyltransferase involved in cell wall biosynthesis